MFSYAVTNFGTPLIRERVVSNIERCATDFGLYKQTLKEKPTRMHWHWKRAGVSGTLEVTWHAGENQIVVVVHKNRVGANEWAKNIAPKFAARLADEFRGKVES